MACLEKVEVELELTDYHRRYFVFLLESIQLVFISSAWGEGFFLAIQTAVVAALVLLYGSGAGKGKHNYRVVIIPTNRDGGGGNLPLNLIITVVVLFFFLLCLCHFLLVLPAIIRSRW